MNKTMYNSYNSPIFVVGSSRSGTTLLYHILLSSGEFPLYEAETLLLSICPVKYGNIRRKRNYKRFIADWVRSKQFLRSGLDPDEFMDGAKDHHETYTDFLRYFMESMAAKHGKNRWVEKTPGHIMHMEQLSAEFKNAKFIHVIRDGRDVALSKRKAGWIGSKSNNPEKQLLMAAMEWEMAVRHGRKQGEKLGPNYLEVNYEDMVCDIDGVLSKINDFANISVDRKKLEDSSVGSLKKANTAFADEMVGISNKALKRWKTGLSEKELATINTAVGDTMLRFGYEVDVRPFDFDIEFKKMAYKFIISLKTLIKQKMPIGHLVTSGLEIKQVQAKR
jgi:hypothetical protein